MTEGCDNCGEVAERYFNVEGDKLCPKCAAIWEKGYVHRVPLSGLPDIAPAAKEDSDV